MSSTNASKNWFLTIGFMAVVTITTLFLRIPTPTGGYFNFGDVAVVFCGLLLGKRGGAIAGGLGSAAADLLSGYAMFAPLTLVAKGLEGFICGMARGKTKFLYHILPLLGAGSIVVTYFIGECIMPQIGFASALAELPANGLQAAGGYIGGKFLFELYSKMTKDEANESTTTP
ncbi:ECF transporter S component [Chitinophaga lutea]